MSSLNSGQKRRNLHDQTARKIESQKRQDRIISRENFLLGVVLILAAGIALIHPIAKNRPTTPERVNSVTTAEYDYAHAMGEIIDADLFVEPCYNFEEYREERFVFAETSGHMCFSLASFAYRDPSYMRSGPKYMLLSYVLDGKPVHFIADKEDYETYWQMSNRVDLHIINSDDGDRIDMFWSAPITRTAFEGLLTFGIPEIN